MNAKITEQVDNYFYQKYYNPTFICVTRMLNVTLLLKV